MNLSRLIGLALAICGTAGCLAALVVLALHQMIRQRSAPKPRVVASHVNSGAPGGEQEP